MSLPLRAVRIPDDLWAAAQAQAAARGHTVSAVVRTCLAAYAAGRLDPEALDDTPPEG